MYYYVSFVDTDVFLGVNFCGDFVSSVHWIDI